jgi:hypothetical protein
MSDETKQKLRDANLGKKASSEAKQKMSLARKGKTLSDLHDPTTVIDIKRKRSLSLKGKNKGKTPRLGAKLSDESKRLIGLANSLKPKHQCPHCDKLTSLTNFIRWHGDSCKNITNKD